MNLKYSLNLDDYLQHQLYAASTTKSIKNKRLKNWITVTLLFVFLAFIINDDGLFLKYYFVVASIASLILYPFFQRYQYKKHYLNYIKENYKNRFGKESNITFNETYLESIDFTGETKLNYSNIEKIIEISSHYFLKFNTGGTLIIPKLKIENNEEVKKELLNLSKKLNIEYLTTLNWKWK